MKFLVFTDIHEDAKALKKLVARAKEDDIDFILTCGDISNFGSGLKNVLSAFNKVGKPFYVVPGNHEEPIFDKTIANFDNCISLHEKAIKIGNYIFLGHGGGGFALEDPDFRKIARKWYGTYKKEKTILVTHQPPYATKLDKLEMGHVGNKDYHRFIERMKPKMAISGHLHETFGMQDKIGECICINPGDEGVVIELP